MSLAYKNVLERENDVYIYARGGEEFSKGNSRWDNERVTWDTHYYSRIATYINLDLFKDWLLKNRIQVIIFNEQHWWPPVLLCKKMGIKTGAYIDYYTRETVPFFEAYDFLVCNTKRHASVFPNHPQCFYIPWGTDVELFRPQSLTLAQEGFVTFFHSAGYSPDRKGTDFLIKAFDNLNEVGAKLVIHCQFPLADYFPDLIETIARLQASKKLEVIEKTITAPGAYHLGDVYVYPTKLEGIGLTIAEALSCGLPVITSDNAPMNEFITNETGRLVKIDFLKQRFDNYYWPECFCNIDDLTARMKEFCGNMKDLPALKALSRDHALQHLDFSKNAAVLNDHLKTVRALPVCHELEERIKRFEKKKFIFIWRNKAFSPLWYILHKFKPFFKKVNKAINTLKA